ncbi:MAG: hypothetical protein ABI451_06795 [Dokdonella sp.]
MLFLLRNCRGMHVRNHSLPGGHDDALGAMQRIGHDVMFCQDNGWQSPFDPLRNDPCFKDMLKKMGLPYTPAEGAAR